MCVSEIRKLGFLELKESRASRTKSDLQEELGGQPVGQEERCRAPLPDTPPAESAMESASV